MKVYGAGLLSSAAELQFVMDGAKVGRLPIFVEIEQIKNIFYYNFLMYCPKSGELPLLELTADDVFSAEIMVTRSDTR